jgi:hypothetical protein
MTCLAGSLRSRCYGSTVYASPPFGLIPSCRAAGWRCCGSPSVQRGSTVASCRRILFDPPRGKLIAAISMDNEIDSVEAKKLLAALDR